jgi:hypothetical protein
MPPEFFIYTAAKGVCTVKGSGVKSTREFSDILDAIEHIRAQNAGKLVVVMCYDATGKETLMQLTFGTTETRPFVDPRNSWAHGQAVSQPGHAETRDGQNARPRLGAGAAAPGGLRHFVLPQGR